LTTADALRARLDGRGVPWPAPIEAHPSVSSTNDRLKEQARLGAPEWSVVLAEEQTGGRGRQGRAWASPRGGLYLSVLLRPVFEGTGLLPLAAGVAVVEALEELGVNGSLKWPNDVLVAGRKVAGLLAEASSTTARVDWVVIGLGVNLGTLEAVPDDVRALATSVLASSGRGPSPVEAAAAVLARLPVWYHALRSDPPSVLRAWRERSVPWWGERVAVQSGGETLRGVARDIDPTGAFLLDLEDGRRVAILSGEVTSVRLR
jgi:BirA family transcriptional regulator, biotin operon repressor / biotin---[acetyl-CoA-carboxylase] ligase